MRRDAYTPENITDRSSDMETSQKDSPAQAPLILDCGQVSKVTMGTVFGLAFEGGFPPFDRAFI